MEQPTRDRRPAPRAISKSSRPRSRCPTVWLSAMASATAPRQPTRAASSVLLCFRPISPSALSRSRSRVSRPIPFSLAQFDDAGNPAGSYTLLQGGPVQSVTLGADASQNPELFAIGSDNQVYYAQFDATGNPLTGLVLAHAGQVKQIAVGADASGNPE